MTCSLIGCKSGDYAKAMTTKDKLKPKIVIEDDPGDIRNCKVVVNCPKKWESLEPLTDVTRHCGTCDEAVFLCKTDAELAEDFIEEVFLEGFDLHIVYKSF